MQLNSSIIFVRYQQTKYNKPLAAIETHECVQLTANEIINSPLTQSHSNNGGSLSILRSDIDTQSIEQMARVNNTTEMIDDKVSISFQEIPGPAILKLWEKYWKYVPIFGTQLFCSLLMNRITEGRLLWNRNNTPLKYFFDEYGPIVRINAPMMADVVMIHRPEHIAQVFQQDGNESVRSAIDILQHYRSSHRKSKSFGPFTMQGQEWIEMKLILKKSFSQHFSQSFNNFDTICNELIHRIRKIRNRQDEMPSTFNEDLLRWGMECFYSLIFNKKNGFLDNVGLNIASEQSKLIDAILIAHRYLNRCETGFQVWRFVETYNSKKLFNALDTIDNIISKNIRQVRRKLEFKSPNEVENSSPVLENFLINQQMNLDDISTLLMDLIILGVQAVSNTQAFLFYFLAKNPRVQRKLYDEVCHVFSSDKSKLSEENIQQTPYLNACLQESLRLRPAFPYISRLLSKKITIHGYAIPKGTYLIMANEISSRREENFEDPEKFLPERWLNEKFDDNFVIQEKYWSCLPFGHGVRSCLGKIIAETQIKLLTAKIVREFKIEYDYADIESKFLLVNVPKKPLRFRFVDRN
ncbi:hypothetical protein PV327_006856 [Microctonus hyperodae]|uniref:Cytochrome P450 n=1 Tax=Microctonus hyperodae TaxID=165561 RepID=A0AA39KIS7_MICHY|nr:hypothetical protein PV327_006856 [Microctonus hyperodae]